MIATPRHPRHLLVASVVAGLSIAIWFLLYRHGGDDHLQVAASGPTLSSDSWSADPPPDLAVYPVPAGREPTVAEAEVLQKLRETYTGETESGLREMEEQPQRWSAEQRVDWTGYRNAGLFQVGPVGVVGSEGNSDRMAMLVSGDDMLLLTMLRDTSPVVRAYAAYYLLVHQHPSGSLVLERTLIDEGRMQCQYGCSIMPCTVADAVGRALAFAAGLSEAVAEAPRVAWPREAFERVAASGRGGSGERARELLEAHQASIARRGEQREAARRESADQGGVAPDR